MDKKVNEARKKAIEALASAIGFWGVDTLETRLFASLYLSPHPMSHSDLAEELNADDEEVDARIKTLVRLGAIKSHKGKRPGCKYYEAESDFFEILQTVLRERREREMGKALGEISRQRKYVEERFDDEGDPDLGFLAERLGRLDKAIKVIDKTMYGLGALASIRGMFKGK